MATSGPDLSWLPSDAEEQLALGFRIVSNAYKTKVHSQDTEIRSIKSQLTEKNEQYSALQKKHNTLEGQLTETTQRANQLGEENKQLVLTIKKLQKDIHRLESLKKAVLNSIQEDHSDSDDHKYYASDDVLQAAAPRTMSEINGCMDDLGSTFLSKLNTDNFLSSATASGTILTSVNDSRQVDGKAFFRKARSCLSYENFNTFLANIKKLNNHQQTREETLKATMQIFGEQNRELYEEFKLLLVRHS